MKKCQHCGKEIQDQNVFCPYCGGKQERNEGPHYNGSSPSGKSLIAMIVGIVAAVVLILVLGTALANRKTTISLNKYMAISFDGYDTMGKAKCEFDADKFE
ncbi:MAG: zinc-ribbon domain-containing protein, partial [Lachnospiraceae bacterium]|nr:zinc-ribbon domain-containing protein [Lachnospiraceae bacterium]